MHTPQCLRRKSMNQAEVFASLDAIEAQIRNIRAQFAASLDTSSVSNEIVIKSSYTQDAAIEEKVRIEHAFREGNITYDKKRGLKMLVTKATENWCPQR